MHKKTMIKFVGAMAVLLVLFFLFTGREQATGVEQENVDSLGIPVEVHLVKSGDIRESLNYMGTVKSKNQAELSFQSPGIIRTIYVAEGDPFLEGQILAELNTEDLAARYEVAQQKIAGAKLNVDYLKDQTEKLRMLYNEGAVSHQQLLDAEYKYQSAVVAYQETLAVANEIGVSINSARIRAPYTGSVRTLYGQEGEMVQPGQAVCSVSETDDLIVETAVIEKDLPAVAVGSRVMLQIPGAGETEAVEGTVSAIAPFLHPQTRTANVEIMIPSGYEYLLPNMSVSVALIKGEKTDVIVVPAEALTDRPEGTVVYVYHEGQALDRDVKVGLNNGVTAEITEGIEVGERVILTAPMNLENGDKVFVYKGVEAD
ncbi:MAG TPA: efflux RND transporter periplasmic adaptor subunit [Bacillota bacterium]|nr:efflux RND transporter periplasmic adaptor subunit [Bacillota bacterium]